MKRINLNISDELNELLYKAQCMKAIKNGKRYSITSFIVEVLEEHCQSTVDSFCVNAQDAQSHTDDIKATKTVNEDDKELSQNDKYKLIMNYFENGDSAEKIAKKMDMSKGAVSNIKSRIKNGKIKIVGDLK